MTRKEFLRILFFKVFSFLFLFGMGNVFAKVVKTKTKKTAKVAKKKRTRKNRRSRKSKKSFRRFKYKRGGPDLKVLTKDSAFSEVPDNGITPIELPLTLPNVPTNDIHE